MTKDDGMSCYSTNFALSGMTGLPVVPDSLTNPIRWNKLFVQDFFQDPALSDFFFTFRA